MAAYAGLRGLRMPNLSKSIHLIRPAHLTNDRARSTRQAPFLFRHPAPSEGKNGTYDVIFFGACPNPQSHIAKANSPFFGARYRADRYFFRPGSPEVNP